jgi:hypothetical protein
MRTDGARFNSLLGGRGIRAIELRLPGVAF